MAAPSFSNCAQPSHPRSMALGCNCTYPRGCTRRHCSPPPAPSRMCSRLWSAAWRAARHAFRIRVSSP
eukprot:3442422-Prymnesium_polylepis.1